MAVTRRRLLGMAAAGATGAAAAPLLAGCDGGEQRPDAELRFPPGFVWGAATSAYQIEGAVAADGRGRSIWDTFSHTPGAIIDGSTGDVACDHYHLWESDLDLMKSLGLASYRFSIAWPRVLPSGRGAVNQKGLDFYKRLIDGLHRRGITPMATLFHWDLPQALQDQGGWENRECAKWFADYASTVFAALGDAVPTWLTINEPKTIVQVGYEYGTMAPGKRDPVAAAVVMHHLALAHGLAVRAFRAAVANPADGPHADPSRQPGAGTVAKGRVGVALSLSPTYPSDPGDGAAAKAATIADGVENRAYLDPIFKGSYPEDFLASLSDGVRAALLGAVKDGDLATISAPIDLLGVNYYSPEFIDGAGNHRTMKPTSVASWEQIYPQGMTDLLKRLAADYGDVPLVITENGVPDPGAAAPVDGRFADPRRVSFLRDHLAAAHQAIQAGVRLEGYHLWSLLDNFEWAQGYTQRWGIVYVDFATRQRVPKDSAMWYRDVIARNGLSA